MRSPHSRLINERGAGARRWAGKWEGASTLDTVAKVFLPQTPENTLHTFMQFRVAFRNLHFKVASEPCRVVVGGSREVLFLLYGSCLPNS